MTNKLLTHKPSARPLSSPSADLPVFDVRIRHTPYRFKVTATETVLAAALRQDIPLPWGCGSGVCGVCMGQVVEGRMVYPAGPPLALFEEDARQGKGLLCTGHACSDLVLDIPELAGRRT